jgi:hypothetical protein
MHVGSFENALPAPDLNGVASFPQNLFLCEVIGLDSRCMEEVTG